MRFALCLISIVFFLNSFLVAQDESGAATKPTTAPAASQLTIPVGPVDPQSVNSRDFLIDLTAKAKVLYDEGKLPGYKTLASQLSRKQVKIDLPVNSHPGPMSPPDIYSRGLESTLIIAIAQDKPKFQAIPASGFVITSSGIAVTNYHVFAAAKNPVGYVAGTHDGKVFAVKEILAAHEQMDIAIIQLDGEGFTPATLSDRAAVGSDVFVIGTPALHTWFFSRGIAGGYAVIRRKDEAVDTLLISAECARGSSGAPVFSSAGEIVGMMSSTTTAFYDTDIPPKRPDQQMVFKNCVTSRQILSLIEK